jgi:hypothetical protein
MANRPSTYTERNSDRVIRDANEFGKVYKSPDYKVGDLKRKADEQDYRRFEENRAEARSGTLGKDVYDARPDLRDMSFKPNDKVK